MGEASRSFAQSVASGAADAIWILPTKLVDGSRFEDRDRDRVRGLLSMLVTGVAGHGQSLAHVVSARSSVISVRSTWAVGRRAAPRAGHSARDPEPKPF
jgi:hypothetical protein